MQYFYAWYISKLHVATNRTTSYTFAYIKRCVLLKRNDLQISDDILMGLD